MNVAVWIKAANERATVVLPSGETGTLVYVGRQSGKAKVESGGKHRRIPVVDLNLDHQAEM